MENDVKDEWHYTHGTLTMLSVSVAQIQSILTDGGESVSELTNSFIHLANTFDDLIAKKTDIDDADLSAIKSQIEQGIIAFQFYDRISQRLEHVSNSLKDMGGIISDESNRVDPVKWITFQNKILAKFTMESERELFRHIINGVPVEEALKLVKVIEKSNSKDNDIELF